MDLTAYIKSDHVVLLRETEKPDIIKRLVDRAASLALIRDKSGFENAVRSRESISSTGIGMGVAIPHGRCREAVDFFVITGISRTPVEWQAIDYAPVKVIFLIGIPDRPSASGKDVARRYLELIAELMLMIKHPQRREALFSATTPEDLIDVLM